MCPAEELIPSLETFCGGVTSERRRRFFLEPCRGISVLVPSSLHIDGGPQLICVCFGGGDEFGAKLLISDQEKKRWGRKFDLRMGRVSLSPPVDLRWSQKNRVRCAVSSCS